MKIPALVLGLLVLSAVSSSAQDIPSYLIENKSGYHQHDVNCSRHHSYKRGNSILAKQPSAVVRRPYDVISYDLMMDWVPPLSKVGVTGSARHYSGVNKILLKVDSANTTNLTFNAGIMRIDSVYVASGKVTTFTQPSNGEFSITVPLVLPVGLEIPVDIYYTYIGGNDRGFYLYPKGQYVGPGPNGEDVIVEERLAYTMSEPYDARYWMPCNDLPYDKAKATITVKVPEGFLVSSNGLLKSNSTEGGVTTFIWSDTTQIATYLMVANASKFVTYKDWYKRVSNPSDSIPVEYYIWKKDYDNTAVDGSYNARHAFRNMIPMMEWYSTKLTEYPFVKYGMTAVQPFNFGGMEHQTMTTVLRRWLRGYDDGGIAHELMHQWTGDLVTCATFNDLWLNEGGATWGEALWNEAWGGKEWYIITMLEKRNGYLQGDTLINQTPIYASGTVVNLFNYQLTYAKPSWIYHMMRGMLGDETFFPVIRKYFTRFGYASIETEDMIEFLEQEVPNPPIAWRTYFDQWIYQAGHPVYNPSAIIGPNLTGGAVATVRIEQTQSGPQVPEVFSMPVKVTFKTKDGQEETRVMINDERDQTEQFTLSFMPDSVFIDKDHDILNEKMPVNVTFSSEVGVNGEENQYPDAIAIFPNPLKPGEISTIDYSINGFKNVKIEVVNSLGQVIEVLKEGILSSGRYQLHYSGNALPSGVYSLRLLSDAGMKNIPFVVVR